MQNKKLLALIVLSVLALISLIYGLTASPKSKYRSAPAAGSAVVESRAEAAIRQGAIIGVDPGTRRFKRSQFKAWKRSPFTSGESSVSTELTLNGIIWNKAKPKAMIGDAMVAAGDTIGGNKVIEILPKKVILNDGTKNFELTIEK